MQESVMLPTANRCLGYCAMQGNLLRHISRIGSLSEAHIVQNVMQPVLQALLYLHEQASPLAPGSSLHC